MKTLSNLQKQQRLLHRLLIPYGCLFPLCCVLLIGVLQMSDSVGTVLVIVFVLTTVAAVIAMSELDRRINLSVRHIRNIRQAKVSDSPFFLLLRSFDDRGQWLVESYVGPPDCLGTPASGLARFNALAILATCLRDHGMCVIVGGEPRLYDDHNAMVIYPDATQWFATVRNLALQCDAVFALPDRTPGFKAELRFIKANDLLRKTVFLMPPVFGEDREDKVSYWNDIRSMFTTVCGVNVPSYKDTGNKLWEGALLVVSPNVISIPVTDTTFSVEDVLQRLETSGYRMRDVYPGIAKCRRRPIRKGDVVVPGYSGRPVRVHFNVLLAIAVFYVLYAMCCLFTLIMR